MISGRRLKSLIEEGKVIYEETDGNIYPIVLRGGYFADDYYYCVGDGCLRFKKVCNNGEDDIYAEWCLDELYETVEEIKK